MSKLLDALAEERAEKAALTSLLGKMNTTIEKAMDSIGDLRGEKSELAKRVEHLERQPMPAKGQVKAVSKAQDGGDEHVETEAEYKVRFEKMTPGQKARESMRKAMSNPIDLPNL